MTITPITAVSILKNANDKKGNVEEFFLIANRETSLWISKRTE